MELSVGGHQILLPTTEAYVRARVPGTNPCLAQRVRRKAKNYSRSYVNGYIDARVRGTETVVKVKR